MLIRAVGGEYEVCCRFDYILTVGPAYVRDVTKMPSSLCFANSNTTKSCFQFC